MSAHEDSAHRSHITLAASPTPATYDMSKNTTGFFFDMVSSWKLAVDHCTLVSEARFFHRAAHARRRRTTNNITIIWIMGAGPSLRLEDMLPLAALHQTLRRVRAHAITPCAWKCPVARTSILIGTRTRRWQACSVSASLAPTPHGCGRSCGPQGRMAYPAMGVAADKLEIVFACGQNRPRQWVGLHHRPVSVLQPKSGKSTSQ